MQRRAAAECVRGATSRSRSACPRAAWWLALAGVAALCLAGGGCGERRKAVEHNNKGFAMLSQKRFVEALTAFDAAIAADPTLPHPYLGKGRAFDETQQPQKAEEALRQYATLSPGDADGHYYLGLVLESLNRQADAVAVFKQSAAQPPTPRTHLAHYRLGRALAKQGQGNDAAEAFRQSIRANPTFLAAYQELAALYADSGDLNSAEQALQNALATKLPEALVHSSLGLVFSKMADRRKDETARNVQLERAAAQFEAATKLKPSYARAYWNLGMTLAKVTKDGQPSRRKDAVRNLQLFLSRHGKDDDLTTQANDMIQHLSE